MLKDDDKKNFCYFCLFFGFVGPPVDSQSRRLLKKSQSFRVSSSERGSGGLHPTREVWMKVSDIKRRPVSHPSRPLRGCTDENPIEIVIRLHRISVLGTHVSLGPDCEWGDPFLSVGSNLSDGQISPVYFTDNQVLSSVVDRT